MHAERTVLPNGLRLVSSSAPSAFGLRLRLTFLAGALFEPASQAGLAHLAEHMPFKGSLSRAAATIARDFERIGAEIDAYTDHYETTYLATAPGTALPELLANLTEMLLHPRLAEADLVKERAVVLEELRTLRDETATVAYQIALGALWRGWPHGRPVAGSRATVRGITIDAIRGWFGEHYGANRLVVGAAGAVEADQLQELVASHLGGLPAVPPVSLPTPQAANDGPWLGIDRREGEQVALCLAMPAPSESSADLPAADLLALLLGGNDCSRLFLRLRDELGLVYGIEASLEVGPTNGQLIISTECSPRSLSTVLSEIERILDDMMRHPPSPAAVADAAVVLRARWLLPFDNPLSYADWLVSRELWHPQIVTPATVAARFAAVTPEEIQALAERCLAPATRHLALAGPVPLPWRPAGWRIEAGAGRARR